MTRIEHTPEGLTLTVRPSGVSRFGGAAFLAVWLCFWAAGETVVLGVLGAGAWSLLQGKLAAPAIPVGVFLLVWVTFWTFGGVMALHELLRLLSSEDVLRVGPDTIVIRRRRGPFWFTQTVPRGEVRGVTMSTRHRMLRIQTTRQSIDFAQALSPADEREALHALRQEFAPPSDGPAALPAGWEETLTPEGERVLVRDTRARKKQVLVLGSVAAFAWILALVLAGTATAGRATTGPAIVLSGIAALFACGAYWLDVGRQEFRLGGERIVVQRRWRGKAKELFVADRLELTLSTDSDGDVWYKLEGVSSGPVDPRLRRPKTRRTLSSALNDPFEPAALGKWLSARSGTPYSPFEP